MLDGSELHKEGEECERLRSLHWRIAEAEGRVTVQIWDTNSEWRESQFLSSQGLPGHCPAPPAVIHTSAEGANCSLSCLAAFHTYFALV